MAQTAQTAGQVDHPPAVPMQRPRGTRGDARKGPPVAIHSGARTRPGSRSSPGLAPTNVRWTCQTPCDSPCSRTCRAKPAIRTSERNGSEMSEWAIAPLQLHCSGATRLAQARWSTGNLRPATPTPTPTSQRAVGWDRTPAGRARLTRHSGLHASWQAGALTSTPRSSTLQTRLAALWRAVRSPEADWCGS